MSTWLAPVINGFVLISDEDRHLLAHKWSVVRPDGKKQYARAQINGRNTYLHRHIMGAGRGQEVDHINGDGLDNSRGNLRLATRSQNCANRRKGYSPSSGFRGVYPQHGGRQFVAKITHQRKTIRGGCFASPEDAARKYDELAREIYGEFAVLNFPEGA